MNVETLFIVNVGFIMIVRKFLNWMQNVATGERAEGVSALARAYLYADLSDQDRDEAEVALTTLLDDASPMVRRAMAEAFASAADAPHHIIWSLAADQAEVAVPVLARSHLLSDAELVDLAAISDADAQSAIALRPELSASVSAALAEIGCLEAVQALVGNDGAEISELSARRIIQRFGHRGDVREALLQRAGVSAALRYDLAKATGQSLAQFVSQCGWLTPSRLDRVEQETGESSAIWVGLDQDPVGMKSFAQHLREIGELNAGLLLRSLLAGSPQLMAAALVELSGIPIERVSGLMRDAQGSGFAALYARAGMPKSLLVAFRAALAGLRLFPREKHDGHLSSPLVAHVIAACSASDQASPQLLSLLRRFEAEAARIAARQKSEEMAAQAYAPDEVQRLALEAVSHALELPFEVEMSDQILMVPPSPMQMPAFATAA